MTGIITEDKWSEFCDKYILSDPDYKYLINTELVFANRHFGLNLFDIKDLYSEKVHSSPIRILWAQLTATQFRNYIIKKLFIINIINTIAGKYLKSKKPFYSKYTTDRTRTSNYDLIEWYCSVASFVSGQTWYALILEFKNYELSTSVNDPTEYNLNYPRVYIELATNLDELSGSSLLDTRISIKNAQYGISAQIALNDANAVLDAIRKKLE